MTIECSIVVILLQDLSHKRKRYRRFTIPCTVGSLRFAKALFGFGASINLMPLSIYKKFSLGVPKPTAIRLLMPDRTVKRPIGVLHDVLVKMESFIFLIYFGIIYSEVDLTMKKRLSTFVGP